MLSSLIFLRFDDICLIKYETKVASTYRLCRVTKLLHSEDGLVRTVEVQLGNKKLTKKNPPVKDLVTAVQRLVLLVPADELEQGPPEPREQPQQVGLAEVLPGRVQNLPGPRTSKPRVRPNNGSAEPPNQPKKLHHGLAHLQLCPLESHEGDPSKRGLPMTTFQPK